MAFEDQPTGVTSSIEDTDWSDPKQVARAARMITAEDQYKRDAETAAQINIEFVAGNQHLKWNKAKRQMERDYSRPAGTIIRTDNRIRPALIQRASRLTRRDSVWSLPPDSDDASDVVAARVGTDVLKYYYLHGLKMPAVIRKAINWAEMSKVAFFCPMWDANAGEDIEVTPNDLTPFGFDQPLEQQDDFTQQGRDRFAELFGEDQLLQGQVDRKAGDVAMDVANIFEIDWWPFDIIDFKDAAVMTRKRHRTNTEIAMQLGVDLEEAKRIAGASSKREDYRRRLNNNSQANDSLDYVTGSVPHHEDEEGAQVIEVYHCDDPFVPGGLSAIVIGDMAYKMGPLPLSQTKRIPIVPLLDSPIEGKLLGTCEVDQLRSMQQEANQVLSDEANHRKNMTHHTVVRFVGDGMNRKDFQRVAGKIPVCADPGLMPQVLRRPEMGSDGKFAYERAGQAMADQSGVSNVDLGNPSGSGIKSGVAIAEVKEISDLRMLTLASQLDESVSEVGSMILEFLALNLVDEKVVWLIGENNRKETVKFNGETLFPIAFTGQNNPALVHVNSFRNLPSSKGQLFATVEALTGGQPILDPVGDRAFISRALGLGEDLSNRLDRGRQDEAIAESEQTIWTNGGQVGMPNQTDDNQVHLRLMKKWMSSEQYRQVASTNPEIAQEINEHYHMHEVGVLKEQLKVEYLKREADLALYQETVARKLQAAQQSAMQAAAQGGDPQQVLEDRVAEIKMMFPGPLFAVSGGDSDGGMQETEGGDRGKPIPDAKAPKQGDEKRKGKGGARLISQGPRQPVTGQTQPA